MLCALPTQLTHRALESLGSETMDSIALSSPGYLQTLWGPVLCGIRAVRIRTPRELAHRKSACTQASQARGQIPMRHLIGPATRASLSLVATKHLHGSMGCGCRLRPAMPPAHGAPRRHCASPKPCSVRLPRPCSHRIPCLHSPLHRPFSQRAPRHHHDVGPEDKGISLVCWHQPSLEQWAGPPKVWEVG